MNSSCRLSRRWHQQFCLSPNFAGHLQCLHRFLPIREYRQTARTRPARSATPKAEAYNRTPTHTPPLPPKSDIVVREYEPDGNDGSKLNRIDPNEEVTEEMVATRRELMKLEQELAEMRQGPFGPKSDLMQSLPKDERQQLLQALAEEGVLQNEEEDLLTMADLERLGDEDEEAGDSSTKPLGVTLRIPKKDQAYIRHFNKALRSAEEAEGSDIQRNLHLWKWYLRCQQQVHSFGTIISEDVWHFLWKSQATLAVRPKHIVMLARDMLDARTTLESHQWISYIESLHASDDTATAITVWQEQMETLRLKPEISDTFWNVGVMMFASVGRPLKAQEFALDAIRNISASPQILIPVIAAWGKSQDPHSSVKAWACYLDLKEMMGDAMTLKMYERVSNTFLDTNHSDMALSVFKDMLLMKENSSSDSREVYKAATKYVDSVLQNATTEEQINKIGLSALLILPKQFQNRFFFTSWIKRLIGEHRIDSAAMVVELMYERGITPDAKPLNGIIGAWLREGSVSSQHKAVKMAWSMIEARTDFVLRRKETSSSQGALYRELVQDDTAKSTQRRVPSATIETFSILLQYYTRRQDQLQAEKLTSAMIDSCQIRPNSYIMNHWLFGDLRAGRLQLVWDKYCTLKRDIQPDLETFAALWDTAKVNCSKADSAYAENFPSARELFAEMTDWAAVLSPKKLHNAKEELSTELYEQIIRTFCLSADLPGTLLTMHELAKRFELYPTDNAVRLICGQASRLLPQEERTNTKGSRARRSKVRLKSVMAQVAEIIETIETKHKITRVQQGADIEAIEDPTTGVAQQLRLAVLTEFLCMFMQQAQSGTGNYRNDVKIAAQSMHVDMDDINLDVSE